MWNEISERTIARCCSPKARRSLWSLILENNSCWNVIALTTFHSTIVYARRNGCLVLQPSVFNDCSVLWIHIVYMYIYIRDYRLQNIGLLILFYIASQIRTYNVRSCSLKMLNAHLYNAQYKHLTYSHLIPRKFLFSHKKCDRWSTRRHFRAEMLRSHVAALVHRAVRNLPLNFNDKIFDEI